MPPSRLCRAMSGLATTMKIHQNSVCTIWWYLTAPRGRKSSARSAEPKRYRMAIQCSYRRSRDTTTARKAVKSAHDFSTQRMSAGANDRVEELLSVLGEHHEVDCLGGERRGSDRDDPPVCQTNHLTATQ